MIDCKKVYTIPQIGGTCWFTALLMVFLYSEGFRSFFYDQLSAVYTEDPEKKKLITMFVNIYKEKYLRANITTMNNFEKELEPSEILQNLHKADAAVFYFNPDVYRGFHGFHYSKQFLRYFDMHERVLYCNSHPTRGKIWVAMDNIETIRTMESQYDNNALALRKNSARHNKYLVNLKEKTNFKNIDVLFVRVEPSIPGIYRHSGMRIPQGALLYDNKLQEEIEVEGFKYRIDGCLLDNISFINPLGKVGHGIAGVTCNGKRYLYNGWVNKKTKLPCPLIEFDWFSKTDDFCIDSKNCRFTKNPIQRTHPDETYDNKLMNKNVSGYSVPNLNGFTKRQIDKLCFNAENSPRTYTYVKVKVKVKVESKGKRKFINLTKNYDYINLTSKASTSKASTSKVDFINLTNNKGKKNKGKGKLID